MESKIYAGLDIGTTKITAIVAEADELGETLRILGVGTAASDGLKRGVVVNLEKTVRSIQHALEEAERVSGRSVKSVWAGIAGDHIRGLTSRGVGHVADEPHAASNPGSHRRQFDARQRGLGAGAAEAGAVLNP